MVLGLIFAAVGWRSPTIWLSGRIGARRKAITKSLPDALDLIIVCVEAGNSLEGSLAVVSEKLTGPLAVEFARTLQEMSLGKKRSDALHDLARRAASPDLQTFVAAVVQADQLGIGIAQVLRVQGDAMRVKRRQRAEESAAKVAVKMLLPLVLFILPALMIIIMGPVVLTVSSFFTAHPTG
jgi:tight adherence protein C